MQKIQKMLEINKTQKEYYEFENDANCDYGGNVATSFWNKLREYQYKMTDDIRLNELLFEKHKVWLGDLTGKRVLDLGCHKGNELSAYLAKNSDYYLACDLSESALKVLESKLLAENITNANFAAMDILSEEFTEGNFDVIYAKSVFHHFEYFDEFLAKIKSLLKPNGIVITFDPIDFYLPLRIVRAIYRPFQFDKNWEFPFTAKSIELIGKYFEVSDLAGMMGKTKYAFPLYLLSPNYAIKKSKQWIDHDLNKLKFNSRAMKSCLRISFRLVNK